VVGVVVGAVVVGAGVVGTAVVVTSMTMPPNSHRSINLSSPLVY